MLFACRDTEFSRVRAEFGLESGIGRAVLCFALRKPGRRKGRPAMPCPGSDLIHPSAIISPEAKLAEDVRVGPFAVIEGAVTVGTGTVIGAHAHLMGSLTIGANNQIGTGCVLGGA